MTYLPEVELVHGFFEASTLAPRGLELARQYASARPFPHIVIDDFLPHELLENCIEYFTTSAAKPNGQFDRDQERFKSQYNPEDLPPRLRSLFYAFNSRPFIRVIENISGIKGLIPDPFFLGAGLHETTQGGHLSIHADFNHHKPMNLERRINVLIYLNEDWKSEYGGDLELWDREMSQKVVAVTPIFNRCVVFNTDTFSYHGNPEPVNHPGKVPRRSIALYYYTSTWSALKHQHNTLFQVRSQTADRALDRSWRERARELMADVVPPVMYRALARRRGEPG